MPWQSSLKSAITALRKEEQRLERELDALRGRISGLTGAVRSRGTRRAAGKRKLSAKGRAAIARAAKKRWAEYRKAKRKNATG
jgi:hypothetical protein